MDTNIIHFDSPMKLQVRDFEKRELEGLIVPFGETINIKGKDESFAKGAFADIDPSKTVLLSQHDMTRPVGRMVSLEEREEGAYATFKVANTEFGNELLQLASEGVIDALSAGFIAGDQTSDGVHTRVSRLPEVSLVTFGAYPTAKVLAVRSGSTNSIKENLKLENTNTTATEVANTETGSTGFEAVEARLEEMSGELVKLQTAAAAPATRSAKAVKPIEWFAAEFEGLRGNYEKRNELLEDIQTRALAHIEGSFDADGTEEDADGLMQSSYFANQLVNVLDARRPMFNAAGKMQMPKSGYALIPRISQHSNVTERSSQMGEPGSQEVLVVTDAYTAKWYAGALEVSLEIIQTAELGVIELLFNDLTKKYAGVTEAALITAVEAAATGDVDDLRTDSYANFAYDVAAASKVVYDATGLGGTQLAIPYATWPTVVAFVDANDRRQFTSGDHSDGKLAFNQYSFTLPGGINVFAAGVTNPLLFNEDALKTAEDAPFKVESTSVVAMSRDIGLLGRALFVPRIPGGIVEFIGSSSTSSL